MGRKLVAKIDTEEEFKLLLNVLLSDLGHVNDYLTLYENLGKSLDGHWRGMSGSQAFWSTVYRALSDAALYGLARAYDQNDDALTLRTLLETIASDPAFLRRPEDFDRNQLEEDLRVVHHDTNRAVDHLMMWRHKFFAHRDPKKIINLQKLSDDYPITWDEIRTLVDTGLTIGNRYGLAFFRTATSRNVHGHQDYQIVLNVLEGHYAAVHARIMEQLRSAEEAERLAGSSQDASPEPGTSGTGGT
jgi:hypothetical protein